MLKKMLLASLVVIAFAAPASACNELALAVMEPATFRLSTSLGVNSASGTYGGTTNLSATLSNGCTPISNVSVAFTLNGVSVGSGTTDSSGTATITGASLVGISVGSYGTGVRASFAANASYAASNGSATLTVNTRALTISATGVGKTYDGTNTATATLSDNRVSGDVFTSSYTSATFPSKTVGNVRTVTVSGISITGTAAGNYTFNTTASSTANIAQRPLTVTATGVNRAFDGTTNATVTLSDNRVSGDVFTDGYTSASFLTNSVGAGKTVNVTGISISGADAANYTANTTAATTADITGTSLVITAAGVNKVYDGSPSTSVTLSDNRTLGDVFTVSYTTATFGNKAAGNGKTVSVSGISISGPDASKYTGYNTTASTTANITARPLTVAAAGVNKIYDGLTTTTVTLSDNRVSGDVFIDGYTSASFLTNSVGVEKTVNVNGISITGADAANYTTNTTASAFANIAGTTLVVTATASNKVYDGSPNATVALGDNRISGDVISVTYTAASFGDKAAGNGKTVSVSGISVSGPDASKYTAYNTTASTTANITARPLTVSAAGVNKTYDSLTTATVTLSDNRISGDVFTDSYTGASFLTNSVGVEKTVNVTGISISGADAANYTANGSVSTVANITGLTLLVTATGVNKVYDRGTSATVTLADNRNAGDSITVSYTGATFGDKAVGNGKTISVSGISISGPDAIKYINVNATASATANITARSLTVGATGVSKVYDGGSAAAVTLSDNRREGDVLTASYSSASFAGRSVGTAKMVSVSGISISGADAGNYSVNTTASTTANITAKPLTITATGVNRVFSNNIIASVTLADNRLDGDVFIASYTSAYFADRNVGVAKPVTVTGISISGADAVNYTFNTTVSTTADITLAAPSLTVSGFSGVYNGASHAASCTAQGISAPSSVGRQAAIKLAGSPHLTLSGTCQFTYTPGGSTPPVNAGSYSVSATFTSSDSNYAGATGASTITIVPAALTVTAEPKTVTYGAAPVYTATISGFAGDDTTSVISGSPAFGTSATLTNGKPNAGTWTITPAAGTLTASNYIFETFTPAALTVNRAGLTVTAANSSKVYGAALPALTATITGYVNGDTQSAVAGVPSATTSATSASPIGAYPIVAGGGLSAANYTFTYVNATLTVGAAVLTVTPAGASRVYGGSNSLSYTITGFTNGDTARMVSGVPVVTVEAFPSSSPGAYTVTATLGNLSAPNYAFAFQPGLLSISPATTELSLNGLLPGVTAAAGQTFTLSYFVVSVRDGDAPTGSITYSVDGGTPQSATLKAGTTIVTLPGLGVGAHRVSAVYGGDANYATAAGPLSVLNVNSASTQITASVAPGLSAPAGTPIVVSLVFSGTPAPTGTITYSVDGSAPQTAAVAGGFATATFSGLAEGSHVLSYSYGGDSNYSAVSARTITVTVTFALPTVTTVVNGADYGPKISIGGWASAFGTALANETGHSTTPILPITLHGAQILINGLAAPLYYASPLQINFQVPYETPVGKPVQVVVISNGVSSLPIEVTFFANAPAIFGYYRTADEFDPIVNHLDGTLVTPDSPAKAGEVLTLYATGAGVLKNAPQDGQPAPAAPGLATTPVNPTVTVGKVAATVMFSGLTPGLVGVWQINVQLPDALPLAGDSTLPLVVTLSGNSSRNVPLYVKR